MKECSRVSSMTPLIAGADAPRGRRVVCFISICAVLSAALVIVRASGPSALDELLDAFVNADTPPAAGKIADKLVGAKVTVDAAWDRLRRGRTYAHGKTGIQTVTFVIDALTFPNRFDVPEDYDPARRWPVRVQLHGGIGRPEPRDGTRAAANPVRGENAIYAYPSGWADAPWWRLNQLQNILTLIDYIKRRYNVDESRIYLTGISDGGTGVYYLLMREPTIWSAGLPLNGNPRVLASRDAAPDGTLFAGNLVNRPLFIVNGERDPLYPASLIVPYLEMFKRAGVDFVFHPQAEAGHDVRWWPAEQRAFEEFVRGRPRDAHPAKVTWETERTDRANRVHWLVIDRLGRAPGETALEDVNTYTAGDGRAQTMFERRGSSGRVDAVRRGNTFEARTRGVRAFTLLLSPDVVDYAQPVVVVVNGKEAYRGLPAGDARTLLKWAARDNDRTMLYTTELPVAVP
jgi:hypothetical protein